MISTVITAFVSFAGTNVDDIFILMLFFSQVNNVMKRRDVIIGQYLGIGALMGISIIGALGISIIPDEYAGLLGFVPIYLGIKEYLEYKRERREEDKAEEAVEIEEKSIKTIFNSSVIRVAGVTIANGGDNIGIYIPLFTSMSPGGILLTVAIFMVLTAFWCLLAMRLSENPFIQRAVEKYKHIFVPIVFIALGVFILIKSRSIGFFIGLLLPM